MNMAFDVKERKQVHEGLQHLLQIKREKLGKKRGLREGT
jgi:hypothetical protein